jgi:hypothetical protein
MLPGKQPACRGWSAIVDDALSACAVRATWLEFFLATHTQRHPQEDRNHAHLRVRL